MTFLLPFSLIFIDIVEKIDPIYLKIYFCILAMVIILGIVGKKYIKIGEIICSDSEMKLLFNDAPAQVLQVKDVSYLKIIVTSYRGKSAGLSGFVATGYENNMTIRYKNRNYYFLFYINDIAERKKAFLFFNKWKTLNPILDIRFPMGAS